MEQYAFRINACFISSNVPESTEDNLFYRVFDNSFLLPFLDLPNWFKFMWVPIEETWRKRYAAGYWNLVGHRRFNDSLQHPSSRSTNYKHNPVTHFYPLFSWLYLHLISRSHLRWFKAIFSNSIFNAQYTVQSSMLYFIDNMIADMGYAWDLQKELLCLL